MLSVKWGSTVSTNYTNKLTYNILTCLYNILAILWTIDKMITLTHGDELFWNLVIIPCAYLRHVCRWAASSWGHFSPNFSRSILHSSPARPISWTYQLTHFACHDCENVYFILLSSSNRKYESLTIVESLTIRLGHETVVCAVWCTMFLWTWCAVLRVAIFHQLAENKTNSRKKYLAKMKIESRKRKNKSGK